MSKAPTVDADLRPVEAVPDRLRADRDQAADMAMVSAGAALGALNAVVLGRRPPTPLVLWRRRLALEASVATLRLRYRTASFAEMRDAAALARDDETGGHMLHEIGRWRSAVDARPERGTAEEPSSPTQSAAAAITQSLLREDDDLTGAVIAGDAAIAAFMRWPFVLPLMARSLTAARLRADPDMLSALCARALAEGGAHALAMAADLQRRAAALQAVAPKLRSKAAGAAVALLLCEDAVTPVVHLTPRVRGTSVTMTDRSARRLCDRLVALKAVRELTGRAHSRLYGL